jgi:RNA polymerase sigma-70 factor, ECF subfamily
VANEAPLPTPLRLVTAAEDLELVKRCVAGDRQAQRALFARERKHVHWTLFRILGHSQHLEDLIQDAFLEVFRSLGSFRGESLLSTWVERCTVRVAYAYFRRKALVPRLEPVHDVFNGAPSAEQRVMHREAARRLYALLDRLEPSQRIAYTLHLLDDKPLKEVASLMQASLVTTKVRVFRARRSIERRAEKDPLLSEFVLSPSPPSGKR